MMPSIMNIIKITIMVTINITMIISMTTSMNISTVRNVIIHTSMIMITNNKPRINLFPMKILRMTINRNPK